MDRSFLARRVQWDDVVDAALQHRVAPILLSTCQAVSPLVIPDSITNELSGRVLRKAARALKCTEELLGLLTAFDDHTIPVIPLKGPALSHLAYGSPAFRQSSDLDLLVRGSDLAAVKQMLLTEGYRDSTALAHARVRNRQAREGCEIRLDPPEGRHAPVELHWRLAPLRAGRSIDTTGFWERSSAVPFMNREVLGFAPEDLLTYLCVHAAKHAFSSLLFLCDLVRLIQISRNLDWNAVVARARSTGTARRVGVGLLLAQRMLGLQLPDGINACLDDDRAVDWHAELFETNIREENFDWPPPWHRPVQRTLMEQPLDRAYARFARLRDIIRPSQIELEAYDLPSGLYPLYFVIRANRLLRQESRAVAMRLRQSRQGADAAGGRADDTP